MDSKNTTKIGPFSTSHVNTRFLNRIGLALRVLGGL